MVTWSVTEKPGVWVGPVVAGVSGRPLAYVIPSVNAADTARILAAAPEMLETLRGIADECERRLRKGKDQGDLDTLRLCRTAIAKAEGRDA
jgi:hypothetical protein